MCPTKEPTVSEQLFDRQAALARVGDDEELLVELVKIFLDDYPHSLSDIEEAVARQDPPKLERAAHTLKGAVANFGAEPVVRQAYALERLGRMGDLSLANESLHQLHEALHQLEYELRPIANSN
jgi:HPt (histidine-containing phosphotransfer) domain-containing protein